MPTTGQDFAQPEICAGFIRAIGQQLQQPYSFMEVCGTHTMAIFQSGLRSILPENLVHVSGPGCPVCVTAQSEIDLCLELGSRPDVILATFGDMLRVPGSSRKSLQSMQSEGAVVRVCYSPFQALEMARENPKQQVVFLGVGFETTAPAVAVAVQKAAAQGLDNFRVLALHKLLPPALKLLVQDPQLGIQGFILPGHVSAVIGMEPYQFLARDFGLPGVIAGFEPLDILQALYLLLSMRDKGRAEIQNQYTRAVSPQGNPRAMQVMQEVFRPTEGRWRGLGRILNSGLALADKYRRFDALETFGLSPAQEEQTTGCRCGEVLQGKLSPKECGLFKKSCTPASPVGPCMVSTEGSCAAYYKYAR